MESAVTRIANKNIVPGGVTTGGAAGAAVRELSANQPKLNGPNGLACMMARSLEEDYRPPPKATGHERALCICGFRGRIFLNDAQLYLPGCNHLAEQFEPFGTFEDTGYRHRLDLDSPFGGIVSPAANRNVDAPVTDGTKGLFPKGRRVEQRVDAIGQLAADRFGEARSALDHDIRAVAAHQLGICWVGVGDDLYSLPFRGRDRVLSQKPSATAHGEELTLLQPS